MKPEQKTLKYYDYREVIDYIFKEYANYLEGCTQYQFWQYVIYMDDSIQNDSYFTMCEDWTENYKGWENSVVKIIIAIFGEGEFGNREVTFWVSW